MLDLTAPQLTVLIGVLRALGANVGGTQHGVLTHRPGVLTSDYFANLLSPGTRWKASESEEHVYEIRDLATDKVQWTATAVDLILGYNSLLRALAEVYASNDAHARFVTNFVAAWTKVMELDRFDLS
jgi:catalase-peroxidase